MKLIKKLFKFSKKANNLNPSLSQVKIAQHEAAHGIVWYLFKDYWSVNSLTIERNGLPDESMNGALHISANFDVERETNIQRANEIFAIAMAGLIGQNIELIKQSDMLLIQVARAQHFNQILNTTGCSGDFEIAIRYLSHLASHFNTNEYSFMKYKLMDLIDVFQNHYKVQYLHQLLTERLLEIGTIDRDELSDFFENNNFQEYIEYENLDIIFFYNQ